MKAVRIHKFGGPEVLQFESNVPKPKCGANQVLVKVVSTGVNPVEIVIRDGVFLFKPQFPYIPGTDVAGIIEEIGAGVHNCKVGDRVFCTRHCITGAYAEYSVFASDSVYPLSEKLSFSQGAAIGIPYFTAYHALFQRGYGKPGESVLIHGASGATGLAAVQIARANGFKVYGTAGTPEGLALVKQSGCHAVFNHRQSNYTEEIMKATGGGVDLILEMLADVNLARDLNIARQRGRIIVIGSHGSVEILPHITMGKELTVTGIMLFNASDAEYNQIGSALVAGIEAEWLKPVVDKHYTLEQVRQSHVDITSNSGAKGKLVLDVATTSTHL